NVLNITVRTGRSMSSPSRTAAKPEKTFCSRSPMQRRPNSMKARPKILSKSSAISRLSSRLGEQGSMRAKGSEQHGGRTQTNRAGQAVHFRVHRCLRGGRVLFLHRQNPLEFAREGHQLTRPSEFPEQWRPG